ncbi:MAG: hypothetical protein ABIB97_02425 [Patescibacteria group bacterium]
MFIYERYFKDVDTLVQLVPQSAHFYSHLNYDQRRDPFKTLNQNLVATKTAITLEDKLATQMQGYLRNFGLDWREEVIPQIEQEIAYATLNIKNQDFPLVLLKTKEADQFSRLVMEKIRNDNPLMSDEYLEIRINNFEIAPSLLTGDTASPPLLNWDKIFYTNIGNDFIISSAQDPIEAVIDTYKERNQSLESKIAARYTSKVFYSYLELDKWKSDSDQNQWLSSWQQILEDNNVEQIFLFLESETDYTRLVIESPKGIFSGLSSAEGIDLNFFNYLPADFQLAVYQENIGEKLKQSQQSFLKTKLTQLDVNSLSTITAMLPQQDIFSQLLNNPALVVQDESGNYLIIIQSQREEIDQSFNQLEEQLKEIASLFHPSEQEIIFDDQDRAIELVPNKDNITASQEGGLGDTFFSIDFGSTKIIYGQGGDYIFLSNSFQLVQSSLTSQEESQQYSQSYQKCPDLLQNEIMLWPLANLQLPLLGTVGQPSNVLIAGSDLNNKYFLLEGCLFLE